MVQNINEVAKSLINLNQNEKNYAQIMAIIEKLLPYKYLFSEDIIRALQKKLIPVPSKLEYNDINLIYLAA